MENQNRKIPVWWFKPTLCTRIVRRIYRQVKSEKNTNEYRTENIREFHTVK